MYPRICAPTAISSPWTSPLPSFSPGAGTHTPLLQAMSHPAAPTPQTSNTEMVLRNQLSRLSSPSCSSRMRSMALDNKPEVSCLVRVEPLLLRRLCEPGKPMVLACDDTSEL